MSSMTEIQGWNDEAVQLAGDDLTGQCAGFIGSWLFGYRRCEDVATVVATFGCVHEHVGSLLLCDTCAERSSSGYCNACTDSAESHECPTKMTTKPVQS